MFVHLTPKRTNYYKFNGFQLSEENKVYLPVFTFVSISWFTLCLALQNVFASSI